MTGLGLVVALRCFIRGCLHSTCTPVLIALLSLRFLPAVFLFYLIFFWLAPLAWLLGFGGHARLARHVRLARHARHVRHVRHMREPE